MERTEIREGIRKVALLGIFPKMWWGLKTMATKGPKDWWQGITTAKNMTRTGIPGGMINIGTGKGATKAFESLNPHIVKSLGGKNNPAYKEMIRQGKIHNMHGLDYFEKSTPLKDFGRGALDVASSTAGQLGTMGLWMGVPMAMDYFRGGGSGDDAYYQQQQQQMANSYDQYYRNKYDRDMSRNLLYSGTGAATGYALGNMMGGYGGTGAALGSMAGLGISSVRNKYEY